MPKYRVTVTDVTLTSRVAKIDATCLKCKADLTAAHALGTVRFQPISLRSRLARRAGTSSVGDDLDVDYDTYEGEPEYETNALAHRCRACGYIVVGGTHEETGP